MLRSLTSRHLAKSTHTVIGSLALKRVTSVQHLIANVKDVSLRV
ncbi:hypothetical protein HNQ72_006234 [Rhizobium wenxiniae]|uniref:Uncharacterized protein n=1 Tax=Rhizobium wenxiniae TaxID=1737357 RepID=A0A7W9YD10_9HYPH|nr:hypothetical protein [Rhizobium wenxiniae]